MSSNEYVYLNGQHLPSEKAAISSAERGLLLGDGFFTTLKSRCNKLILFSAHYRRLEKTAAVFNLPLQYQLNTLKQICTRVIENNQLSHTTAVLRITLTRGDSSRGLDFPDKTSPTLLITAAPYVQRTGSISLTKASALRPSNALTSLHKTLNYLEAIMAREHAKRAGYDDAIFCNEKNQIVCTSAANLFFVKQGILRTPALCCGALPGVMREWILAMCRERGILFEEGNWKFTDLLQADEVFITNCLIEILPIRSIGERYLALNTEDFSQQLRTLAANILHA